MEQPKAHPLRVVLMNLTLYPGLVLMTLACFVVFPPFFLVCKCRGMNVGECTRLFIWYYGRVWKWMFSPFVTFSLEGMYDHDGAGEAKFEETHVLVLNHLSFFDIYCMGAQPAFNVSFMVRSWPFKMFWYAPFMRMAGYLDVESLPPEHVLEECKKLLNERCHLLFFPEGHRSRMGKLQRFYSGAFKAAVELRANVLPLCITGTDQLLPPGRYGLRPAHVRFRALDPVDVTQFTGELAHVELRKHVKKLMAENIAQMREDSP